MRLVAFLGVKVGCFSAEGDYTVEKFQKKSGEIFELEALKNV